MKKIALVPLYVFAAVAWLLLAGCQPAATPVPTDVPAEIPSSTFTRISTKTATPTPSETPTRSPTLTPTQIPTSPYNLPGNYGIYRCASYTPGENLFRAEGASLCLQTVYVRDDSSMQFNVKWYITMDLFQRGSKSSDANNKSYFLLDDLGNTYHHYMVGGCAATETVFRGGGDCNGWFLFPPAKPGATSFVFYDIDHGIGFTDIVLVNDPGVPTRTFTPLPTPGSYNSPGTYWIYKCSTFVPQRNFDGATQVILCLNTVAINEKNEMRFNVNWKITYGWKNSWNKQSDANNYEIYLEDNLGNTYNHIFTGGCAGQETFIVNNGTVGGCNGWFQFPPAKPDATSFRFIDYANLAAIENIILLPKQN